MTTRPTTRKRVPSTVSKKSDPVKEMFRKPRRGRLTESEMDKAEIVLTAKAIINDLQDVAEKLAKVEADQLMPISDLMRTAFGPDMTDSFNNTVTEHIRSVVEVVKKAKSAIGNEVAKLEGSVNGSVPNDMAMSDMDAPPAPPSDSEMTDMSDDMMGDEIPGEDEALDAAMPSDELDAFGDEDNNAAGRPRKESARPRKKMLEGRVARRMLRESDNPDGLILAVFRTKLKETRNGKKAASFTSSLFCIDSDDVVSIVRESVAAENPWQHLSDQGYDVTCDGPGVYYWHAKRKDGKPYYDDNQDGTSSTRYAAWADLEATLSSRASTGAETVDTIDPPMDMDDHMSDESFMMDDPSVDMMPENPLDSIDALPPPVSPPPGLAKPMMAPPMMGESKSKPFGGKKAMPFGAKKASEKKPAEEMPKSKKGKTSDDKETVAESKKSRK